MKQLALHIETMRKRRDFIAARSGARISGRFFAVQCRHRSDEAASSEPSRAPSARFGLTVTKKTGNGVERNRIKRRLREAIRQAAPGRAMAGFDYVVFAHRATLNGEFTAIAEELAKSLDRAQTLKEKAFKRKDSPIR